MGQRKLVITAAASAMALALLAALGLAVSLRERSRAKAVRRLSEARAQLLERDETAARALRTSEEKYRQLVENANDVIFIVDREGYCLSMNRAGRELSGYVAEEPRGVHLTQFVAPEQTESAWQRLRQALDGDAVPRFELDIVSRSGKRLTLELDVRPVPGEDGIAGVQGIARDVTARKELEAQLRQAQKMEAIGRLAGGIAHDFNNVLTVVLGCSELAVMQLDASSPVRQEIEEIQRAGHSAAALTEQLLIFSRKSVVTPQVLDLNDLVRRLNRMLRRLVGEHIHYTVGLGSGAASIFADAGQIEQVVMNLAVNARDAMPAGGTLTIETDTFVLDGTAGSAHPDSPAGRYVRLRVSDTGVGMTEDVQAQIFLPFFTTKGPGMGTGLGLATVHGIVREAGGSIAVESAPGQGSAFTVCFPLAAAPVARAGSADREPILPTVPATILFVEDDDQIRTLGARSLQRHGFTVLTARHAAEAATVASQHGGSIDLLLTDMILPGLSGRALADQLRATRPDLPVLYTSGYTDDSAILLDLQTAGVDFVAKPYAPRALARKVTEVLTRPRILPASRWSRSTRG